MARTTRIWHRTGVLVTSLGLVVALCACGSTTAASSPQTAAPAARLLACASSGTFSYASVADTPPNQTNLDVYTPSPGDDGCSDRPLVVWVHGGAWAGGDKTSDMPDKVALFNGAGYVFASINYRLTDQALTPAAPTYPVHNADSAQAIGWLVQHADELGIDATRIAVIGHSAGGGITSALATDERYLGAQQLPLDTIGCAGSMDGEGYDVTEGATTAPEEWRPIYTDAFGTDPAVWADASPVNHVAPNKGVPRFFIAARGVDWRLQQHLAFIDALGNAGVAVTTLDSRALEHSDLNTIVGAPGDTLVTPALMDFLGGCFAPAPPAG